jgi:PAS domain S-box-containing protein
LILKETDDLTPADQLFWILPEPWCRVSVKESRMGKNIRSALLRYGLPLFGFVLLLLFPLGLQRFFSIRFDSTFLVIALMIASAWFSGRGPGLMIALLFEVTIDYFGATPPTSVRFAVITFNRLALFISLVVFTSSRRKAENRLRQQHELLQVTLSSIGDAVIATDLDGRINFLNPTAEALTGWAMSEAVNQPLDGIFTIVNEKTRQTVENPFALVKRKGAVVGLANHTVLLSKDGREIPIEDSGAPIKDADGKMVGVVLVFHDVSERRRAEQEREELLEREQAARNEAEAANRLKDEFLATVSHELRTPLNAILGWATLLNLSRMDEETVHKAREIIERNARAQAEIISDILDVSRIIAGKLRINAQPLQLAPILQAAVDTVQPAALAKTISLTTSLAYQTDYVIGDADRLQQIIWNLVSNAIKFTPEKGSVDIRLEEVDSHLEVKVIDNGVGIDPKFLPFIFERFRQADSSMTRAHGGLGLGLAIVRHLVELHGGTVAAESGGENQGTSFTVRLPIATVQVSEAMASAHMQNDAKLAGAASPLSASAPDLRGLRVLVVDDEPDALEIISTILILHGATVFTADSSADALRALRESKPDILISDLGMPDEDGYTLIGKIRALPVEQGGRIPAAALTAYAREEDRQQSLAAGFQAHIAKPVDPSTLANEVVRLATHAKGA